MILNKDYFKNNALDLAKDLLGKILVREIDGKIIKGRIVETEAYIGNGDKACHAYNGRRTKRTEILYSEGGVAYIYLIYGMYNCLNVVSGIREEAEAVLIRAIEPLNEFDYISKKRFNKGYDELKNSQKVALTNGPGKLCKAFSIERDLNWCKLYEKGDLYLTYDKFKDFNIITTKRIGIDYAEEAKDFLWRFYIEGNKYISKK
ncbi:DNA-3-methyladenine glycosylase [Clostridium moniliforme]|uniref:Putative 3-methyladenine DNA glycosylase n=1 Tax=Clostridium moniliforme TaxID=39489 RepID=A0ABS4EWU3_9CLOT|nr:DNA-3-methyladenine glycosylase [Clostridium moniliforme]MBP1888470.1 DNA-3-methyladenine glycosylase [Clostridium moniliforme]